MIFIGSQASPVKEGVHMSLCNLSPEYHLCSRLQYTDWPGLHCGAAEEPLFKVGHCLHFRFGVLGEFFSVLQSSACLMQIFKDFSLEYLLCLQKSDEFHTVGEAGGSENQGHFRVN